MAETETRNLRRSRRLLRAVAAPVAVFVLALSVVIAGSGREAAEASGVVPPVALPVGTTLPGGGTFIGTCAASGVCAATVALAAVLWFTRDTWVPVARDAFSWGLNKLGVSAGGSGASVTASVARWTGLPTAVKMQVDWSGCNFDCGFSSSETRYWQCKSTTSGVVTAASSNSGGYWSPEGTGSAQPNINIYGSGSKFFTQTVCGAGQEVVFYRMQVNTVFSPIRGQQITWGEAVPDAKVSQTSVVHCKKPDGTVGTITRNQVGFPDQIIVPSCIAEFGLGSYPIDFAATGGWPGAEQNVMTVNTDSPATKYPDCFGPAGEYLNTCRIRVWINGQPCAIGIAVCTNWQTYEQDHPGADVRCQWGPYTVPMEQCELLAHSYRPDSKTSTLTQVDPKTGTPTVVVTVPPPDWWTKTWIDLCLTLCTPPPVPPDCIGPTCTDPSDDDKGCMAEAVSFNPLKWVYVPVKCVLKWAFIPPAGYWDAKITSVRDGWNNSSPGKYLTALSSAIPSMPSGSSCQGIAVHTDLGLDGSQRAVDFNLGAACSGDTLHVAAGICKAVLSAFLVLGAMWQCARLVIGVVYPPILQVGQTSGWGRSAGGEDK